MPQDTPVTIGPILLSPAILTAIIAAIASIIVAVISLVSTMRNTRKTNQLAMDLEAYKNTLVEQQEERNAWREYRYEARKRLYQQYEPLLFQLVECCEGAKSRIDSLA